MKSKLVVALSILAICSASNAHAQAYCQGKVTASLTLDDGRVMIESEWRRDWTTICNINDAWKGIPAQTCWAWFAQMNEAVQHDRTLIVYYTIGAGECGTMPTYDDAPRPTYVLALSKTIAPIQPPSISSKN